MATRYTNGVAEPSMGRNVVVLARTSEGWTRLLAEIRPAPTPTRPFRVRIRFANGRTAVSSNLGSAIRLVASRRGIDSIMVRRGTADRLYGTDGD